MLMYVKSVYETLEIVIWKGQNGRAGRDGGMGVATVVRWAQSALGLFQTFKKKLFSSLVCFLTFSWDCSSGSAHVSSPPPWAFSI